MLLVVGGTATLAHEMTTQLPLPTLPSPKLLKSNDKGLCGWGYSSMLACVCEALDLCASGTSVNNNNKNKSSIVVQICNLSTQEMEAGGPDVLGHPQLYNSSEDSLGYMGPLCQK